MNKLEKVFTKFANKKIFILSKNHSITYQEMYLCALAFVENLQNKHKSLSGKIIFLNMERSHNYFIAILSLIFLGATIIPISDKINNLELNYLRKKYKPFLEIENFNVRKTKKKVRVPQNFLLKSKIIFFTSGTTGKPRGILHNISNLLLSAESFSTLANYKAGKKILHNWPHYYMAGFFNMFLCSLVKGCTIVLDDEIGKNNYLKYWSTLKKSKIDFAYLSPTMAQALIAYSTYEKNIRKNSITTSIISTGMSNMKEIRSALKILTSNGNSKKNITVLQCNTEYPTPMVDANIKAITSIKKNFNVNVGYSDHTAGIEASLAAVALGAKIIEKHLTINKNLPGPDHKASINPKEFSKMVRYIRNITTALGSGIKKVTQSELKNIKIVRTSIVAAREIKKGEKFSKKNLTIKRPGTGISPMKFYKIIGKIALKNFSEDEIIKL